jgi:hypothetical protein
MAYCAPNKGVNTPYCLDDNIIDELTQEYNNTSPDTDKIDMKLKYTEKIEKLIKKLSNETGCDKEYCLLKSKKLGKYQNTLKKYYRPETPSKWKTQKRTWLNTLDILASMKQYSDSYPDFDFLSVSPIDFDTMIGSSVLYMRCVDKTLCKLQLSEKTRRGKHKIGAIFNLDKHNQDGSHWVAFFGDFIIGEVYYFDSVAQPCPPEVVKLMERITDQGHSLLINKQLKIKTSGRFSFMGNTIDLGELIQWLSNSNNFLLYRYGLVLNIDKFTEYKFSLPSIKNVEVFFKSVRNLVHSRKAERFIYIHNIDDLVAKYELTKNLDEFAIGWIFENIKIAIQNYLSTLKIVKEDKPNGMCYQISSIKIEDGKIILDGVPSDKKLVDVSFKNYQNFIQHQYKNTECGVYSINFIDNMLTSGKGFYDIITHINDDDTLNNMRYTKYYRPT